MSPDSSWDAADAHRHTGWVWSLEVSSIPLRATTRGLVAGSEVWTGLKRNWLGTALGEDSGSLHAVPLGRRGGW